MLVYLKKRFTRTQKNKVLIFGNYPAAYLSILMCKSNTKVGHCPQNCDKGLYCVAVHYWSILFEVFRSESTLMNNSGSKEIA